MADRKAELERKKAKLEQMRQEKKRKEEERKRREAAEAAANSASSSKSAGLATEADQLLKDLGISSAGEPATPVSVPAAAPVQQPKVDDGGLKTQVTPAQVTASPQTQRKLMISKVSQTDIPPKELVSYSKTTQTVQEQPDREDEDNDSMEAAMHSSPQHGHKMPHVEHIAPAVSQEEKEKKEEVRELSEEEKRVILMSEDFQKFFQRSTTVIERALTEPSDSHIFINYSGDLDLESDSQAGEKLKLSREFFDDRWSKHRTVTCMDWSTQHPELLVASYNTNEEAPHEPDGVALVWNIRFKKTTPEYIFHCQSAVMSTCFAKFHPNLVVGGTYSGQIVLWDNRSSKRTPVQRTPLSAAAHTHPVYCVNVVGTQNAHNLISVSTDGKMCSWSLDMLSQPQDNMDLNTKSQSKAVACTGFSFLRDDVNNFVVGSEEGVVYTACRHGSKAGIADVYEGHQGPITGIDTHCVPGPVDFSQLFLSSSFDWTVKLWSARENKVLYSFEDNSDYVYDVQWSPVHPAVFASVDGAGRLDIWNLNNDTEVPTTSTTVGSNTALNRCRWHQLGHQIAVGDDMGKIHIYELGEQIASPRNDEWSRFVHTLQELKNNASDADRENPASLTSLSSSPLR